MDEILAKIKNLDVASVIEASGVELKTSGSLLQGFCPLHGDQDTPSLVVYPNTNSWACFGAGCGGKMSGKYNGGDAIEWIKQKEGLDFFQAVQWLGERYAGLRTTTMPRLRSRIAETVTFENYKPKVIPMEHIRYWHLSLKEKRRFFHMRGFTDETINRELWGYNGRRYVIPVWDDAPGDSACIGARLRKDPYLKEATGPKYMGVSGFNVPTVWGKWYCKDANIAFGFAGELDAARAVQDGFAAFSMVNGANAFSRFPEGWPDVWFPKTRFLIVVFDKREEVIAGRLASVWAKHKGQLNARVFHWPPDTEAKDYCEFRDLWNTPTQFYDLVMAQLKAIYV